MLGQYIRTDALLGKFFETFLFEDVPANEASLQQVYLGEVAMSDIYMGLYGNRYGYEDAEGVSPTEREYDRAAELHKTRLIYIKSIDEVIFFLHHFFKSVNCYAELFLAKLHNQSPLKNYHTVLYGINNIQLPNE